MTSVVFCKVVGVKGAAGTVNALDDAAAAAAVIAAAEEDRAALMEAELLMAACAWRCDEEEAEEVEDRLT